MTASTTLLTIPETAARLGIDGRPDSVYRLIHSGDLRAVNIATGKRSRLRVREDDLAAFIESRTTSTSAPSVEDALAASS